MTRITQVAAAAALTSAAVVAASARYQSSAEARDRDRFPAPGRLVDIGDHRLHLLEAGEGEGAPTVVIIPALGDHALLWIRVQRALATTARVCVYDRGGIGWSDPPPSARRTPSSTAAELRLLLDAAQIRPPYILVGHSLGGLIARRFATQDPSRVAGMVLVDSSHEQQATRLRSGHWRSREAIISRALTRRAQILGLRRAAASAGLLPSIDTEIVREVPGEFVAAARAISLSSRHRRAVVQELFMLARPYGQLPDLGSLPLTVLTAPWDPVWEELQGELAELSSDCRHVTVPQAGHYIHLDEPSAVIEGVQELITRTGTAGAHP